MSIVRSEEIKANTLFRMMCGLNYDYNLHPKKTTADNIATRVDKTNPAKALPEIREAAPRAALDEELDEPISSVIPLGIVPSVKELPHCDCSSGATSEASAGKAELRMLKACCTQFVQVMLEGTESSAINCMTTDIALSIVSVPYMF